MKKAICFAALLIMVVFCLCSCESNKGSGDTQSSTTDISATTCDDLNETTSTTVPASITTENNVVKTTTAVTTTTNNESQTTTTTTKKSPTTTTVPVTSTESLSTTIEIRIPTYDYFPHVPDFGKMLGIDFVGHSGKTIIYSIQDVAKADPDGTCAIKYEYLLKEKGFNPVGSILVSGVTYYGFENPDNNTTVMFGVSPKDGIVIITILETNPIQSE